MILGYVILSKVIRPAFRLVIPVILILVLGSAGALSSVRPDHAPERYPVNQSMPHDQVQHRSGNIGDLRLCDFADVAVDAA
jgi:hypothetical protein